jgi:hypothetical protein
MASSTVAALTEDTAPLGNDLLYVGKAATSDRKIYNGSYNLLPDGHMINGSFSVTVAANNITVALKTKSGGNPSATDPVSIWINGAYRRCTAALSVTKNAGTQWFNLDTRFSAQEVDFFIYLGWNTTPATDIVDIGFSRIPYGRVYSDFSATTTNEKYLAFANASTPTSTDNWVNVGRFAATLSATYNWSVPTYTNLNLIQSPYYETRLLTMLCTPTALAGAPTTVTDTVTYRIRGKQIFQKHVILVTNKGTASSGLQVLTPLAITSPANVLPGAEYAVVGYSIIAVPASTTALNLFKYDGTTLWTNTHGFVMAGWIEIP